MTRDELVFRAGFSRFGVAIVALALLPAFYPAVLLKEIGAALSSTTRATDVTGRYGGDEFLLVLPDTDSQLARRVAERMVQGVRDAGAACSVTASVGIAVAAASDTAAILIRRADDNAYRAKQQGGDRVVD